MFKVGQPLSHVSLIAKRTGRKEIKKMLQGREINKLNARESWPIYKVYYHDWTLTLKQRRESKGKGPLLFRVMEIVPTEKEGYDHRATMQGLHSLHERAMLEDQ